jgi:hypothetical protein
MDAARVGRILLAVVAGGWLASCGGGSGPATPGAPQGVTATGGDESVTVEWAAAPGAISYNVYWSTAPGVTPASGAAIPGATSPYLHTGRTNGIPCYYVVTAVGPGGESAPSSEVSATPAMGLGRWDSVAWDHAVWGP